MRRAREAPLRATLWVSLLTLAILQAGAAVSDEEDREMTRESPAWTAHEISELAAERRDKGGPWHEFLRVETMSAGLYELAEGAVDRQRPHSRDEIYYVVAGRARFTADGEDTAVSAGSVLYVRAGVEHRFHEITEPLRVLVVFAGAP